MIFGFDFQRDEVSFSFLLSHPTALSCIATVHNAVYVRAVHQFLQDTQLFELLAQLLDVKTDDAVIDIHVGVVVKNVQTALNVDFQRSRHMAGFRFVLRQQGVVQIFQQRHIFRGGILEILAIDHISAGCRF